MKSKIKLKKDALKTYLDGAKINLTQFAKEEEIDLGNLSRIVGKDRAAVSQAIMIKILNRTGYSFDVAFEIERVEL